MFYARAWSVELVLKIIIANGIGVIMAHNKVSFGCCEQLSVGPAFQFGVCRSFAWSSAPFNKFFDAFSQPKLVYEIDVEPVAELFSH
ncbi:hypothetical protein ES703_25705 [subsurface metagenome]